MESNYRKNIPSSPLLSKFPCKARPANPRIAKDQWAMLRYHSIRRPPGTLPLFGNGIWFLQPRHRLLDWFSQCERKTGFATFEISVPTLPPAIVINDPRNVEHVLKNHELFVKGRFFRSRSWDLFGRLFWGKGVLVA